MEKTTVQQDEIAALRNEPTAEIKYLSDGSDTKQKIVGVER